MIRFRAESFRQDSLKKRQTESQFTKKLLGRRLESLLDLLVIYFDERQRSGERCQRPQLFPEIFTSLGDALPQEREVVRRAAVDGRGDVADLLLELLGRVAERTDPGESLLVIFAGVLLRCCLTNRFRYSSTDRVEPARLIRIEIRQVDLIYSVNPFLKISKPLKVKGIAKG